MQATRIPIFLLSTGLALALGACGGGGGNDSPADSAPAFSSKFNAGQMSLNSTTAVSSSLAADSFDDKYLDQGVVKGDIAASVAASGKAVAASPDLSLFPMAQVSNVVVSDCNNGICTLTGTLTNSDADTTSVDFSTKVKAYSGLVLLYGDQSATPSI